MVFQEGEEEAIEVKAVPLTMNVFVLPDDDDCATLGQLPCRVDDDITNQGMLAGISHVIHAQPHCPAPGPPAEAQER